MFLGGRRPQQLEKPEGHVERGWARAGEWLSSPSSFQLAVGPNSPPPRGAGGREGGMEWWEKTEQWVRGWGRQAWATGTLEGLPDCPEKQSCRGEEPRGGPTLSMDMLTKPEEPLLVLPKGLWVDCRGQAEPGVKTWCVCVCVLLGSTPCSPSS